MRTYCCCCCNRNHRKSVAYTYAALGDTLPPPVTMQQATRQKPHSRSPSCDTEAAAAAAGCVRSMRRRRRYGCMHRRVKTLPDARRRALATDRATAASTASIHSLTAADSTGPVSSHSPPSKSGAARCRIFVPSSRGNRRTPSPLVVLSLLCRPSVVQLVRMNVRLLSYIASLSI